MSEEINPMRIMVTHQNARSNKTGQEYDLFCIQSKDELFQNEVFCNVVDQLNGWAYIEISKPTIDSVLKPLSPSICNQERNQEWKQIKIYRHKLKIEIPEGEIIEEVHEGCEDHKYFYFEIPE